MLKIFISRNNQSRRYWNVESASNIQCCRFLSVYFSKNKLQKDTNAYNPQYLRTGEIAERLGYVAMLSYNGSYDGSKKLEGCSS